MQIVCRLPLKRGEIVKGMCINKTEDILFVMTYDLADSNHAVANIQ